jgi:hypothetical protein
MMGQWFLLGKEIDHRLRIYFKVNSSLDRLVSRFLLGMIFFTLYFNLLSLFPAKWIYNLFWTTWVALGVFYSWPTRGKIIEESVSSNFTEFRFLDSFEKTLVGLVFLVLLVSMPALPTLTNFSALKLFFDQKETISPLYWNFISVHLYPFRGYPELFKMALSMHFYFINMGLYLLCFYAFLRYFVSRRLSILGVFALLTSWSFSKILGANFGDAIHTTYSLFVVWAVFWSQRSDTYRSGLLVGLVGFWGTLINLTFAPLLLGSLLLIYFYSLREKTLWFRRQFLKYASLGVVLSTLVILTHHGFLEDIKWIDSIYWENLNTIFFRKAFNILGFIGVIALLLTFFSKNSPSFKELKLERQKALELILGIALILVFGLTFNSLLIESFFIMWVVVILSLIPIELIFRSISRLRSRRNMIYLIYILICLLDSHFEGRVKIFLRMFDY